MSENHTKETYVSPIILADIVELESGIASGSVDPVQSISNPVIQDQWLDTVQTRDINW